MDWLISANSDHYNHAASFHKNGYVDWVKEGRYSLGDSVYIYVTKPTAMVLYKTQVDRIFAPGEPVTEDYEYWIGLSQKGYEENKKRAHIRLKLVEELGSDNPLTYSALHDAGLPCAPQTVMHLYGDVLSFVEKAFSSKKKPTGEAQVSKINSIWNRDIDEDLQGISPLLISLIDCYCQSKSVARILFERYGDEEFCATLHKESQAYIYKVYNRAILRQEERVVVLASLALISIHYYDHAFWQNVHQTYSDLYDPRLGNNSQRMDSAIKDLLRRGFDNRYTSDQIVVSIPIMAGLLSLPMIDYFIDFVADIYRLNFENQLFNSDQENDQVINDVLGTIQKTRNADENDDRVELKIGSTPKLYHLSKYLVADITQGLYQDDLRYAIRLFLKKIDAYHWNYAQPKNGIFFDESFEQWLLCASKRGYLDPANTNNAAASSPKSQRIATPHFSRDANGQIFLTTLPSRLSGETDISSFTIVVKEDGQDPQYYRPVVKDIVSGYLVRALRNIPIKNPLNHISYALVSDSGTVWDSKKSLFRDAVFFGEDGEEIFPEQGYCGNAICLSRFLLNGEDVSNHSRVGSLWIYSLRITPQSVFTINGEKLFFSSYNHPGLFGVLIPDISALEGEQEIPVYASLECLVFETSLSSEKLALISDGQRTKISDLPFHDHLDGAIHRYVVALTLSCGLHHIAVEEIATESILQGCHFSLVLDPSFTETEEMVTSSFLPASGIVRNITGVFSDLTANGGFSYRLFSSSPFYALDDGPVGRMAGEKSINEFRDAKFISISCGYEGTLLLNEEGNSLVLALQKQENHRLLFAITPLMGVLSEREKVEICFKTANGKSYSMIVHAHAFANEEDVTINVNEEENAAIISGLIHGGGEVHLQLFAKGQCLLDQPIQQSNFSIQIPNLQPFTVYRYLLEVRPSFFDKFEPFVIGEKTFSYTSDQALIGHTFILKKISFTNAHGGVTSVQLLHAVKMKVYQKDDYGDFLAKCEKRMGNHFEPFLHLPKVHIEEIVERSTDALWVKMASDSDVLFYDNKEGCIYDGQTNDTPFTIDEGILVLEE